MTLAEHYLHTPAKPHPTCPFCADWTPETPEQRAMRIEAMLRGTRW